MNVDVSTANLSRGPQVLSLYDSLFLGGARVAHTEMVCHLHNWTDQHHSMVSYTDRVVREGVLQHHCETLPYKRIQAAGVPSLALRRDGDASWTAAMLRRVEKLVVGADVILSLKEQPLPVLSHFGTHGKPLIVALHRSDPQSQGEGVETLLDMASQGLLARAVACAYSTKAAYEEVGLPGELITTITNGVNLSRFYKDDFLRESTRASMGITEDDPVVLLAARFDPMKNVELFLEAATAFAVERPEARFILCGAGMSRANAPFEETFTTLVPPALWDNFLAIGIQPHMNTLYNAADLVALTSSYGEAGPLCLLEAMAAGAIPLTTPVGDAAQIVGDERLVTGYDPTEVAAKWSAALEERSEHTERIIASRESFGDRRVFEEWADLIAEVA